VNSVLARKLALRRSMQAPAEPEDDIELILESDVPIPGTVAPPYRWLRKALARMQVGQSVVFNGHHGYVHWLAALAGIRVRTRMIDGEKIPMRGRALLRIWRVK